MKNASVDTSVLEAWHLEKATCTVVEEGLINQTFLLQLDDKKFILQKLHAIFSKDVHKNIHALTQHLKRQGFCTPELVLTQAGQLEHLNGDDIWRLLSYVPGDTFSSIQSSTHAFEAGVLVGHFHQLLLDLDFEFIQLRSGVHDTRQHLEKLKQAITTHPEHRLYEEVCALNHDIAQWSEQRLDFDLLPQKCSHGDLKISNLMFDTDGKGLCLIDLDTVGLMPWPVEMADAFRSWCAPYSEDDPKLYFDAQIFESALTGYFSMMKEHWTSEEKNALVPAIETICMELSVRFLADALSENYFGFDAGKYPARGEHNLARAQGQWTLCCSVRSQRKALQRIVDSLS